MTQLVVDLSNPADVTDALKLLETVNDGEWPSKNAGNPTTSRASANRTRGGGGGSASASADERPPWESDDGGSEPASATPDDDPWATSTPASSGASGSSSGPSKAQSEAFANLPDSGNHPKQSPTGHQVWGFGQSDAPDCECGLPAVKVWGWKGKDSAQGKPSWVAWRCPLSFGKDYKLKCKFNEFTR